MHGLTKRLEYPEPRDFSQGKRFNRFKAGFGGGRPIIFRLFVQPEAIGGGVGIFDFDHFLGRFIGFRTEKLRFFGLGVSCGLRVFLLLAFGLRFSENMLAVVRI